MVIILPVGEAFLKLEVCAEDVIRVAYAKDRAFFGRKSLATEPKHVAKVSWRLAATPGQATLATAKFKMRVDLATRSGGLHARWPAALA